MFRNVLTAALVMVTGCSIALTSSPSRKRSAYSARLASAPRCSANWAAPTVDVVLAVAAAALIAAGVDLATTEDGSGVNAIVGGVAVVGGALNFVPFTISAIYGYSNAHRCAQLRERAVMPVKAPAPKHVRASRAPAVLEPPTEMSCRDAFQASADGAFLSVASLPTGCELADTATAAAAGDGFVVGLGGRF